MTREMEFRLEELLGSLSDCNFLDPEQIEALARERLPADRARAFEAHARDCVHCVDLAADLRVFLALAKSGPVGSSERRVARQADREVRRRLGMTGERGPGRWALRWLPAAAVAAVLLFWFLGPAVPPPLFEAIDPPAFLPPPAVRGPSLRDAWDRAGAAWAAGDLAGVAAILDEALRDSPDNVDLLFYLGVTHLRLGEHEAATQRLGQADRLQAEIPSEQARWYLAVALDRLGRRDEACETLRSVAALGGARAPGAAEIVSGSCDPPRQEQGPTP